MYLIPCTVFGQVSPDVLMKNVVFSGRSTQMSVITTWTKQHFVGPSGLTHPTPSMGRNPVLRSSGAPYSHNCPPSHSRQHIQLGLVNDLMAHLVPRNLSGRFNTLKAHTTLPFCSNARIVSSAGSNTIQFSGDNISPPYHHVHTRRSSSPVAAHQKNQHIDTRHISPMKSLSAKPTTVYVFARPCI